MTLVTLKRPAEFRRVRGGARVAGPLFILEGRPRRPDTPAHQIVGSARFGFTITRKVGNAVVRNRIRRRLREALRAIGAEVTRPDFDYVVVASRAVHDYPFAGLRDALSEAFERLHRQPERGPRRGNRAGETSSGRSGEAGRPPGAPNEAAKSPAGTDQNAPGKSRIT
ncbi:MAG: ribonuclease P protein component [Proteobacteria bacterium]|nr:ribonuclease P protein component [Pseudomonadota bacterium]